MNSTQTETIEKISEDIQEEVTSVTKDSFASWLVNNEMADDNESSEVAESILGFFGKNGFFAKRNDKEKSAREALIDLNLRLGGDPHSVNTLPNEELVEDCFMLARHYDKKYQKDIDDLKKDNCNLRIQFDRENIKLARYEQDLIDLGCYYNNMIGKEPESGYVKRLILFKKNLINYINAARRNKLPLDSSSDDIIKAIEKYKQNMGSTNHLMSVIRDHADSVSNVTKVTKSDMHRSLTEIRKTLGIYENNYQRLTPGTVFWYREYGFNDELIKCIKIRVIEHEAGNSEVLVAPIEEQDSEGFLTERKNLYRSFI